MTQPRFPLRQLLLEELEDRVMLNATAVVTEGNPLTFTDADGDVVTVTVSGPGQIDIEFTGPTQDGSDIATAQISGGSDGSTFDFSFTGVGNGVQVTNQLAVGDSFEAVEVDGQVADLQVDGDIASTIEVSGALGGGTITGDVRGRLEVGSLTGTLTVNGASPGRVEVHGNLTGALLVEGGDLHYLRVEGTVGGKVGAADDIDHLVATGFQSASVAAGFLYDPAADTLTPTDFRGDIRHIILLGGGMQDTTFVATDDLLFSDATGRPGRLVAPSGAQITGCDFLAGFGPGDDGEFLTNDDVILHDGRIGNIGSASHRFAQIIDTVFAASGRVYDVNSAGDLNPDGGAVWAMSGDIDDIRAGGTLGGFLVAGDDIDSISAHDFSNAFVTAGFQVSDVANLRFAYSGARGDIRRITLLGGGMEDSLFAASDDILFSDATGMPGRLAAPSGAQITNCYFSAGFGPGPDGHFTTEDDVALRDGRIGNIGSASHRFESIAATFVAAGRLYDINSAGDLGTDTGDYSIRSLGDIDDIRAGGVLYTPLTAGDDIDSITAASIDCGAVLAGYAVDMVAGTLSPTGKAGDIRHITLLGGGINETLFAASDDILYGGGRPSRLEAPPGAAITDSSFIAGIDPGPDSLFGTDDDVALRDGRIGNIGSASHRFESITASFVAAGRLYDINSAGDLGDSDGDDLIYSLGDIDDLRAGGTIYAAVAAGDDIDTIRANRIETDFIAAGFDYDLGNDVLLPSGMRGDIRRITLLGGGIVNTTVAASDDLLYTGFPRPLALTGGEVLSGSVLSAGFGPGNDGTFGTNDDTILSADGRIGYIGTFEVPLDSIQATVQATGRIYGIYSTGDLNQDGDFIWSMDDINLVYTEGVLRGQVLAGDDIHLVAAKAIDGALLSAGFDPGANGLFENATTQQSDDTPTGRFAQIGQIYVFDGDISDSTIRATGDVGLIQVSAGSIVDTAISAGYTMGDDGLLLTGDDESPFDASITSILADDPSGGILATYISASDSIYQLLTTGQMGTPEGEVWAENDIDYILSVGDVYFNMISAGGTIGQILVNEPDDLDASDPTIHSEVFASRIILVEVEAAEIPGLISPQPDILHLDTDNDGV